MLPMAIEFTQAQSKLQDHLVSKTYMTRVEGENTRLRDYLARLHRKTLCYSKSLEMLKYKGSSPPALSQIQSYPYLKFYHYISATPDKGIDLLQLPPL